MACQQTYEACAGHGQALASSKFRRLLSAESKLGICRVLLQEIECKIRHVHEPTSSVVAELMMSIIRCLD